MQGLDLINSLLVAKGDTVLIEQETYGGALTKLNKLGANVIGIPLDDEGLRLDAASKAPAPTNTPPKNRFCALSERGSCSQRRKYTASKPNTPPSRNGTRQA